MSSIDGWKPGENKSFGSANRIVENNLMPKISKKRGGKMPSAPIKSPTSNIKGIGKNGPSFNNIVPLSVDPKFGSSAAVTRAIQKPNGTK